MIYELAQIEVLAGSENDFEQGVAKAANLFQQAEGYRSLELQRSIEMPSNYVLKVGWNCVEDHMVTFRESESFQRWRELVAPYFAKPPKVQHVSIVDSWI